MTNRTTRLIERLQDIAELAPQSIYGTTAAYTMNRAANALASKDVSIDKLSSRLGLTDDLLGAEYEAWADEHDARFEWPEA